MPVRSALSAGVVSPTLPVPKSIERPEYVGRATAAEGSEPWVQTPEVIEKMRIAGRIAAGALAEAGKAVAPGVSTDQLDRIAHQYMIDHDAYPSTLGYKGFPKSCCTSLNEIICHGIPDSRKLVDGDIVNIDVTCFIEGVHGDTNCTFTVGDVDDASLELIRATRKAMHAGIDVVKPGARINEIGRAIEASVRGGPYGVVREFIGHGIGDQFHTSLQIPHYYSSHYRTALEEGMTFTIEPMITLGNPALYVWDDDWTAATISGQRCAQFEHTMVVTANGVELLTVPADQPPAEEQFAV